MKKLLSVFLSIFFIGLFIIYFGENREDFYSLLNIPFWIIFAICILHIGIILIDGLIIKVTLSAFDKKISPFESFYVSFLSRSGNYLTPFRGGAGIRAFYLKSKFDFKYSHFVSTLLGYYLLIFLVNSLIGIVSLGLIYFSFGTFSPILFLFFILVIIFCITFMIIRIPTHYEFENVIIKKIYQSLKTASEGWNLILKTPGMLRHLMVLLLVYFFIFFVIFFLEFYALGISFSLEGVMLYTTLSALSLMISITPGSIGIREAVFFIFSTIIGIGNDDILNLAVLDRSILFFLLIIMLIILNPFKAYYDRRNKTKA